MAEDFITKFNRLLGTRAGMPAQATIMPVISAKDRNAAAGFKGRSKTTGGAYRPSSQLAKLPKRPSAAKGAMTPEQKKFAQALKDIQERKVVEDALNNQNPVEKALGAVGGGFVKGLGEIFQRTEAVTAEPVRRMAESIGAGEPGYSLFDDIITGAVSGAVHGNTDWGEAVEATAKNSVAKTAKSIGTSLPFMWPFLAPAMLGAGANNLAEDHPDAAKWYKRGAAATGTLVLDPLNLVGGKVVGTLAKTGEELTEASIREFVEETAKTAAKTHLPQGTKAVSVSQGPGLGNTFVSGAGKVGQDAGDAAVKTVLEITGGAQGGKIKYGNKTFGPTVNNQAAEAYRTVRLSPFEKKLERWVRYVDGTGPALTEKQIKAMRAADPEFSNFLDNMMANAQALRIRNPPKTLDDLVTILSGYQPDHLANQIGNAADAARAGIADEVARFTDDFSAGISKFAYNAPGIRLIGGTTIPFRRVGRAYAGAKEMAGKYLPEVSNPISFESKFQGRLAILSQKVKSMGVKPYEKLKDAAQEMAKPFSKEQRTAIADALDSGVTLTDPNMEAARQWLRQQYDTMLDEEVGMGTRAQSEQLDNYQFVFNKGGSAKARRAFREDRKNAVKNNRSLAGFTRAEARARGLKPVDDPFDALLYRKADSNRSMTRAWFKEDLLQHYGLMARNLSNDEVQKRGLKPFKRSDLSVKLNAMMHPHDTWYLPKEMHELLTSFEKLTALGSEEGAQLVRIFDNLTNKFKFLATVPNTGFHVRNMIGDIYMGFLDGVRSKTYGELFTKIQLSRAGKNVKFHIGEGLDMSYDELNDLYMRHAAGSRFYSSDISPGGIKRLPGRVGDKLRDVSQGREDFGRMAHFLHALREEYPAALKAGKKNALDKAVESTVYRVNKYKFDYGALTAVEHKIKKIVPFYTYSRKAVPTLMEAFFLSPRWMGRTYKAFQQHQGANYQNFNHMLVPDYMREIGYATLADEEEPWAIGGDLIPSLPGVSKLSFNNRQDFAQSILANLNPMIGAIPELAQERYAFNQSPIGSNWDYLKSKFPPYSGYEQWTREGKSFNEKLMQNRLFGGGLPIRKITSGQQNFAYEAWKDEIIDTPFREFNRANEDTGIRVYTSKRNDGTDFQVKDSVTGAILFTSMNPEEALSFANTAAKGSREIREPIPEDAPFSRQLMNSYFGQ